MEAVEAELESSEDEDFGGVTPPPNKRSRFEGSSTLTSSSRKFSGSSTSMSNKGNMQNKMISNGDPDSSENGDVILEHPNGVSAEEHSERVAALKERNRDKIAKKKMNKFEEEMIRLIGQHLDKLGLQ